MMDEASALYRTDLGGVATITLDRPDKLNALSVEMIAALGREVEQIGHDTNVRCVVLRANGRSFCGGADLKQIKARREAGLQTAEGVHARADVIFSLPTMCARV